MKCFDMSREHQNKTGKRKFCQTCDLQQVNTSTGMVREAYFQHFEFSSPI